MRLTLIAFAIAGALSINSAQLYAQDSTKPAPDNTKTNQRDRSQTEPTADQAKNNPSDRETMQKIRKAVVEDKSLSTYAHNVKIIAQNGKVTLKGPVRSEEEKQSIEQKAADVAGAGNVVNEITVKPEKTNKSKTGSQ
ncbi:MAG TPA: BON domain-containing protein [Candidatus Acidoferrales bacterium]|nr:BON domain-containing protein [Candidatus Acidoferrales bacterium]